LSAPLLDPFQVGSVTLRKEAGFGENAIKEAN
jgi:hypothetical protein